MKPSILGEYAKKYGSTRHNLYQALVKRDSFVSKYEYEVLKDGSPYKKQFQDLNEEIRRAYLYFEAILKEGKQLRISEKTIERKAARYVARVVLKKKKPNSYAPILVKKWNNYY